VHYRPDPDYDPPEGYAAGDNELFSALMAPGEAQNFDFSDYGESDQGTLAVDSDGTVHLEMPEIDVGTYWVAVAPAYATRGLKVRLDGTNVYYDAAAFTDAEGSAPLDISTIRFPAELPSRPRWSEAAVSAELTPS
jgi:hypothetical protein